MSTDPFWSRSGDELLAQLATPRAGLSRQESSSRLQAVGPNRLRDRRGRGGVEHFLGQFKSPIMLLLLVAAVLSAILHDRMDAGIVLMIVGTTGVLGYWQERGAANAVASLLALVEVKARVRRDGQAAHIPLEQVVPGDIVELAAGDAVPGDCLLLSAQHLFVDEAALTGETFPVEKSPGERPADALLSQRGNVLFMGTHVVSGTAVAVVVQTGQTTELGRIAQRLSARHPETEFELGIRRFGYLLLEVTVLFLTGVFAVNVYLDRPVVESLLFALALAVGLTPQLLPAIIQVNLARGARDMADHQVIVKRLASIENLGSMNVLCSDKTGTLTTGVVVIEAAVDPIGQETEKVLFYAFLNAIYETGYANPIDEAIRRHRTFELHRFRKLDEVPYDFIRKRLSIVVDDGDRCLLITKGAVGSILPICTRAESHDGESIGLEEIQAQMDRQLAEWGHRAMRVLAVAYKQIDSGNTITAAAEKNMTLLGFLLLRDPLKPDIVDTVRGLQSLGVRLKLVTGDNRLVAAAIGQQIGWDRSAVLTGEELLHMSEEALVQRVSDTDVFAQVEPNQKERIILALRKAGFVVGYLGDGINDAPALHAADVSLSVDTAVDVAKEAADIVLMRHGLDVLIAGVREGRRTFANTLKYVHMATSANFGNMFSMAGASLFLPFLPLLPKQVLLMNLMTDLPEMTIATDSVDPELTDRPRRWSVRSIRNFMLLFGVLSSVFDYVTFAVLLLVLRTTPERFRTGWFLESMLSAVLVVLVIRSRRPFFRSRPGSLLQLATVLILIAALVLPFTPLAGLLGFVPLPFHVVMLMLAIVAAYVLAAEICKRRLYAWAGI